MIYLLLAAFRFIIDHGSDANFVPVDRADDWLHVGLGVAMIAMGLVARRAIDQTREVR